MATLNRRQLLLYAGLGWSCLAMHSVAAATEATEDQIKAVFVFNFSQFVDWPEEALVETNEPFVIGVLGNETLAAQLDEAVRDEQIGARQMVVHSYPSAADMGACQILFIDRSEAAQLDLALARLEGHSTLTVSDLENAARQGVMIQLAMRDNRIRLLINVDSARAAGLTISSNLLRPAEIVRTER